MSLLIIIRTTNKIHFVDTLLINNIQFCRIPSNSPFEKYPFQFFSSNTKTVSQEHLTRLYIFECGCKLSGVTMLNTLVRQHAGLLAANACED